VPEPGDVSIFPSQRAALRFIPIAAGLFVAQVLLGGLLAHFYIERAGFFGIEELFGIHILQVLPFSIAKTWHIDLGILWIASTWLGAGLFLPPLLTGHEPRNQARYVNVLLGALVTVVVGGMGGIWLGANGYFDGQLWWLLGNEGLEYLEVGKVWQGGLLVGFVLWAILAIRGLKPLLDREPVRARAHDPLRGRLDHLAVRRRFHVHAVDEHGRHGILAVVGRPCGSRAPSSSSSSRSSDSRSSR